VRREADEFGPRHSPLPSALEAPERTGATERGKHLGIRFDLVHLIQNVENGFADRSDRRAFLAVGKP
jgi:hypothetical protein